MFFKASAKHAYLLKLIALPIFTKDLTALGFHENLPATRKVLASANPPVSSESLQTGREVIS
jgi:hypothetical protein